MNNKTKLYSIIILFVAAFIIGCAVLLRNDTNLVQGEWLGTKDGIRSYFIFDKTNSFIWNKAGGEFIAKGNYSVEGDIVTIIPTSHIGNDLSPKSFSVNNNSFILDEITFKKH